MAPASPSGGGITDQAKAASQYSAARGGRYLRVLVEGRRVHETSKLSPTAPVSADDMTRVFATLLLARLVQERRLRVEDEVARLLPGFAEGPPKDSITIGDLMGGTSGLAPLAATRAEALVAGVVGRPGFSFAYGPTDMWILGAVAERILGQDPVTYLQATVLDPLKIAVTWDRDPAGAANLAAGAVLLPSALGTVGQLILDSGRHAGTSLVDSDVLKAAAVPGVGTPFGAGLWTVLDGTSTDVIAFGQPAGDRTYVVPSRRLVIVRIGEGSRFDDAEFLRLFDVVK